jgi:tetratricopeptide (TPR) repeat protein
MAGRVFISHAAADRELAQSVCQFLEGQGLGCWLAPRDVPAGSHWAAALMEAIDNSLAIILLLSESSSQSGPVMHEIVQAGSQNKPIFTLKLGPVTLPPRLEFFLAPWHWLDLATMPLDEMLAKLADALQTLAVKQDPLAQVDQRPARSQQPTRETASEPPRTRAQAAPATPVVTPDETTPAIRHPRPRLIGAAVVVCLVVMLGAWWGSHVWRPRSPIAAPPIVPSPPATSGDAPGGQEPWQAPLRVAYQTLEQGDDQQAQVLFQGLAAQAQAEGKSQALVGLAAVAWARGDAPQTAEWARQAEAADPEVIYSHVLRGHLLWQQGQTAAATVAYRTATAKTHGLPWHHAVAYNRLGRLYAAQGDTQQALALYDQALSLATTGHPERAVAYTNKGHGLATLGRYPEALGSYRQALQLNPDDRLTTALLHEADRRAQLAQDQAQQERIDQLVAALLQRHREGKGPGSADDDWTSRPFVMGLPPLQSQGTPAPRAGEDDVLLLRLGEAVQAQHITLVERAVLDKLLAELKLSASELVPREAAARVGRFLAARLMAMGSLTRNGAETRLSLRVVDTETTVIQAMTSVLLQPPLEREGIADPLVAPLVQKLRTAYPLQGRIVETTDDEVVLNIGADHGVVPGLTLQVLGDDDPSSAGGTTASPRRRQVGMLEVTRVEDARLSRAKVLQQTVAFGPGWKVREQ